MGRRGVTVLLGAILVVLLVAGIVYAPVPYVTMAPGPTVDTLGEADGRQVIEVSGRDASTSAGQLRLVTVTVISGQGFLDTLRGWWNDDEAVVPRELIYPPDESEQQVDERNRQDFEASQTSAETVALRESGFPVHVMITEVTKSAPADGKLAAGDEVTTVDGQQVTSGLKLQELIRAKPPGTAMSVGYIRSGQPGTTTITTAAGDDGKSRVGVAVDNKQPHPFTLKIELDKIGGPSAGLMFALGIIDKLDSTDLTGGTIIAGTGSIDDEGRVGVIGGIPQKLVAARAAGAKVFLTPEGNCAEAMGAPQPDLKLVKVSTIDDALAALQALRDGREPTLCGAR